LATTLRPCGPGRHWPGSTPPNGRDVGRLSSARTLAGAVACDRSILRRRGVDLGSGSLIQYGFRACRQSAPLSAKRKPQRGCGFRRCRPGIPIDVGHLFRPKSAYLAHPRATMICCRVDAPPDLSCIFSLKTGASRIERPEKRGAQIPLWFSASSATIWIPLFWPSATAQGASAKGRCRSTGR
jgi:hypothetical protein